VSFHDLHDLAAAAVQADFCALIDGLEVGIAVLVAGILVLARRKS
jgi:hypothetical protein